MHLFMIMLFFSKVCVRFRIAYETFSTSTYFYFPIIPLSTLVRVLSPRRLRANSLILKELYYMLSISPFFVLYSLVPPHDRLHLLVELRSLVVFTGIDILPFYRAVLISQDIQMQIRGTTEGLWAEVLFLSLD